MSLRSDASQPLDGDLQETNFEPSETRRGGDLESIEPLPIPDDDGAPVNGYGSFRSQPAKPGKPPRPTQRAVAPDLLRGTLMVLMALDHESIAIKAWPHGLGNEGEADGQPVTSWNRDAAYVVRMLTHLCAPGFTFLLGLGVVYFGASRTKLGWSAGRMTWHFFGQSRLPLPETLSMWLFRHPHLLSPDIGNADSKTSIVRMIALIIVNEAVGFGVQLLAMAEGTPMGPFIWLLNIVLVALGVDYFLAGLTWLALVPSEKALAHTLAKVLPHGERDEVTEPLLASPLGEVHRASDKILRRAADISWHIHNAILLALGVVTIWWNHWLSPTGGQCTAEAAVSSMPESLWFRFWFYFVKSEHVMSGFPPLAWISFAFLGILYGRILLARPWTPAVITIGTGIAGLVFLVLFILARVFQFGSLADGCLQLPDIIPGEGNPWLTSPRAFFYIVKYPPDFAFWSFTMAGNLLLLAAFGAIPVYISKRMSVLLAFGTSALFFYVLHQALLFLLAAPLLKIFGHLSDAPPAMPGAPNEPALVIDNLWGFFGIWIAVLAIMYPLCRWYGSFKARRGVDSLWRFF